MFVLARLLYRVRIVGEVPPGPSVVAANHESVLDPPLLALASRQPLRFLAKEELWRYRPGAWLMDALGGIPVRRGREGHVAVAKAVEVLAAGEAVAIFPQGSVRGGIWTRGAARLALETGAPIVPVRIVGAGRALSRGRVGFPRITVVVGEPIPVARAKPTVAAARELTRVVQESVAGLEVVRTASYIQRAVFSLLRGDDEDYSALGRFCIARLRRGPPAGGCGRR